MHRIAAMNERVGYLLAAGCVLLFLASQTFQEIAYLFWIPASHGFQDELLAYLLPVDRARALLVMAGITALIVPFIVIALRCFQNAPVASTCGLIFRAAFIGFEISQRGVDFVVVAQIWATRFAQTAVGAEREALLRRFEFWNEIVRGWYFPLLFSYFLASVSFAIATWKSGRSGWLRLAPAAFVLNALRLVGRLLSNYAGQQWLNGLNDRLYFPAVLMIGILLLAWFLWLAKSPNSYEGERRSANAKTA